MFTTTIGPAFQVFELFVYTFMTLWLVALILGFVVITLK